MQNKLISSSIEPSDKLARFADDFSMPEEAIIFAGISMRLQPKLAGRKLDAFAELFRHTNTKYKFVYLGDTLQRFNSAALYIVERIKQGLSINDDREWNPQIFLIREKQDGNAWCESHSIKFNPHNDRKMIIRDSDIIISKHFSENLNITIGLYLESINQRFIQSVNETVRQYMTRNAVTLPSNTSDNIKFSPLKNNDPIDSCVKNFLKTNLELRTNTQQSGEYLSNPLYQALLKLSFSYVLYELAGFRTALQKIKDNNNINDFSKLPIYFLYPGKLDVVTNYFQLFQGYNVIGKEIIYKSISPQHSSRIFIPGAARVSVEFGADSSSSMDESSSDGSPPSQDEILLVLAAHLIANKAAGKSYTYQDQIRTIRGLRNPHSFTNNIGSLTCNNSAQATIINVEEAETETEGMDHGY